jgi:hypothetical protein
VGAARSLCLSKRLYKGVRRSRARVLGIGVGFVHMRSVDLAHVARGRVPSIDPSSVCGTERMGCCCLLVLQSFVLSD